MGAVGVTNSETMERDMFTYVHLPCTTFLLLEKHSHEQALESQPPFEAEIILILKL